MKVYSPSDIAKLLNVKESTLRKYSILLEKNGITFKRNNQNQRWYSDEDVILFQKLTTLKNNGDMSLEESAKAVCLWSKGDDVTQELTVTDNDTERYDTDIKEIKELIHTQNEIIKELSNKLNDQQQYIEERMDRRDQLLIQSLRETLDTQKQIATTQSEHTEDKPKEQPKQSFWKRIFGGQ
jgi:DNA-binding transcriptional MerR regulator